MTMTKSESNSIKCRPGPEAGSPLLAMAIVTHLLARVGWCERLPRGSSGASLALTAPERVGRSAFTAAVQSRTGRPGLRLVRDPRPPYCKGGSGTGLACATLRLCSLLRHDPSIDNLLRTTRLNMVATQIITLIGVLIGAAASYFATTSIERARHRRALETRWDERKLNTYVDYVSAVKATNIAATKAFMVRDEPKALAASIVDVEKAGANRSTLFESLILLADPAAVEAANVVNQKLRQILNVARDPVLTDDADRERLSIELMSALTDLHEQARLDLGITGQLHRA